MWPHSFFVLAPGLSYDLSNFNDNLTPCFVQIWKTIDYFLITWWLWKPVLSAQRALPSSGLGPMKVIYDFRNVDWHKINKDLMNAPLLQAIQGTQDVECALAVWESMVTETLLRHIPITLLVPETNWPTVSYLKRSFHNKRTSVHVHVDSPGKWLRTIITHACTFSWAVQHFLQLCFFSVHFPLDLLSSVFIISARRAPRSGLSSCWAILKYYQSINQSGCQKSQSDDQTLLQRNAVPYQAPVTPLLPGETRHLAEQIVESCWCHPKITEERRVVTWRTHLIE